MAFIPLRLRKVLILLCNVITAFHGQKGALFCEYRDIFFSFLEVLLKNDEIFLIHFSRHIQHPTINSHTTNLKFPSVFNQSDWRKTFTNKQTRRVKPGHTA